MEINEVIIEAKETIYSESMVKELVDKSITDYERGIVAGRIEMMNWIIAKLESNDETDTL